MQITASSLLAQRFSGKTAVKSSQPPTANASDTFTPNSEQLTINWSRPLAYLWGHKTDTKWIAENYPHLKELDLSYNLLNLSALSDLESLTALQSLNLNGTSLLGNELHRLNAFTNLRKLGLSGTQIQRDVGTIDYTLIKLSELKQLQELSLAYSRMTDDGLSGLKHFPRLQRLDLEGCRNITDAGIEHMKGLSELTELRISNAISETGLERLGTLLPQTHVTYVYDPPHYLEEREETKEEPCLCLI